MNLPLEFQPNAATSKAELRYMNLSWVFIALLLWTFVPLMFMPKPSEVLSAFRDLWMNEGLGGELVTSFLLNLQSLFWATILSLGLAYLAVVPIFRPAIAFFGKLRFLSLAGLSFFFTLMTRNGHQLKVSLLVFSVTVFFLTSMADVVASVPKEKYDLARTLRMGEWRVVWEVVILGQADKAFDALRQNAAMGWLMLTLIETISREGGGIGTLLMDQNKHFHLAEVFAIQICILVIGIAQDWAIGAFKKVVCPYADMTFERR